MNELIPLIEQLASDAPEISPWMFGSLLAKAHVEVDHTDEALRQLEAFAASGFDLQLDQVWLSGMVDYADAAVVCGDPTYARPLFERLAPWHAQLPATGASALPPVSHYLGGLAGVLGRYDEADAYFSQSAAMSERLGAKFFAARTDLWWGNVLARRNRPGDADAATARLSQSPTSGSGARLRQRGSARHRGARGHARLTCAALMAPRPKGTRRIRVRKT